MLVKDIFELRNHLGGKLLLLEIVTAFDDATDQAKARLVTQSTEGILLCNFHAHFIERLLPKQTVRFLQDFAFKLTWHWGLPLG